jgi:hypothetical protein
MLLKPLQRLVLNRCNRPVLPQLQYTSLLTHIDPTSRSHLYTKWATIHTDLIQLDFTNYVPPRECVSVCLCRLGVLPVHVAWWWRVGWWRPRGWRWEDRPREGVHWPGAAGSPGPPGYDCGSSLKPHSDPLTAAASSICNVRPWGGHG